MWFGSAALHDELGEAAEQAAGEATTAALLHIRTCWHSSTTALLHLYGGLPSVSITCQQMR
jgi:hypothetical protein